MRFTNAIFLGFAARGMAQSSVVVPVIPTSQAAAPTSQVVVVPSSAAVVPSSVAPVVSSVAPVQSSVAVPTSAVVVASSSAVQQLSSSAAAGSQSSAAVSQSQSQVVSVVSSVVGVTSVISGSTVVGSTLVQVTTTATVSATGTGTSKTASATSSVASAAVVPVKDSVLTQNSKLTEVEGQPAVLLTPPAYGQASCYVNAEKPKDIPSTEKVRILATLLITRPQSAKRSWWKRQSTSGCDLSLTVDGTKAYSTSVSQDTVTAQGGKLELSSDAVQAGTQQPKLEFSQTCRQEPVQVTMYQLTITGEKSNVQTPLNPNQVSNNSGSGNNSSDDKSKDKGAGSSLAASGITALWVAAAVAFFL